MKKKSDLHQAPVSREASVSGENETSGLLRAEGGCGTGTAWRSARAGHWTLDSIMDAPYRVLLATEDEGLSKRVGELLASSGSICACAGTVDGALSELAQAEAAGEPFDVLAASSETPGNGALRLFDEARRDSADLAIIVFSENASLEAAVQLLHYGVFDYIAMPVELGRLVARIRQACERRRMGLALTASEARYRLLAENATDVISCHSPEGCFLYASPSARSIFGIAPESLVGRSAFDWVHPDDRDQCAEALEALVHGGGQSNVTCRVGRVGASYVWTEATCKAVRNDTTGKTREIVCVIRDISARREAEGRLAKSEARYRLLTEASSDVIWTIDSEMRPTYASPSASKLTGYTMDELRGITIGQLLTPSSYRDATNLLEKQLRAEIASPGGSEPGRAELQFIRKDGTTVWTETVTHPLRDETGARIGFWGNTRDISRRKRMEQTLRESEERYHSLFDRVPVGLYRTNADGEMLDVNLAAVRMFGFPNRETMLAANVADLYEDASQRPGKLEALDRDGTLLGFRIRARRYDGSLFWIEGNARAVRDFNGEVLYYEGSVADVTAEVEADLAAAESQAQLGAVLENAPIVLWRLDAEGRFVFAKGRGLQSMDVDSKDVEALVGESAFDFLDGVPEAQEDVRRALRGERFTALILVHGRYFEVHHIPQFDEKGNVTGVDGVSVDVTDRIQSDRER